jgi:hypothetical protein
MIVIVMGLPGTGKSHFASRLASQIRADYISSDQIRKSLFPKSGYSEEEKLSVYQKMYEAMQQALNLHHPVVLDATFYRQSIRKAFLKMAAGKPDFFLIELTASENLIRERLRNKRTDSEADWGVYLRIAEQWEPLEDPSLTLVCTNENEKENLTLAMAYLKRDHDAIPN